MIAATTPAARARLRTRLGLNVEPTPAPHDGPLPPRPADEWPDWTDMAFDLAGDADDLPWREDDRVTLGPAAAIGGGR